MSWQTSLGPCTFHQWNSYIALILTLHKLDLALACNKKKKENALDMKIFIVIECQLEFLKVHLLSLKIVL